MENKYHITAKLKLTKSKHIHQKNSYNKQKKSIKKFKLHGQWSFKEQLAQDFIYQPILIHQEPIFKNYQQQYHRVQQNIRMISRIMQPKRDKIIVRSVQCMNKDPFQNNQNRSRSQHILKRKQNRTPFKNKRTEIIHQHLQSKQNLRMASRIINARSCIQTGSPLSGKKKRICVNEGVKCFFFEKNARQQNVLNYCDRNSEFIFKNHKRQDTVPQVIHNGLLKPYYGFGPTILEINTFQLLTNPLIKDEELISLQLLIQYNTLQEQRKSEILKKSPKNNLYIIPGVNYSILKKHTIKFAIRIKNIGEYVPLRIWKFDGLNSIEIGTADLHFGNYLDLIRNKNSTKLPLQSKNIVHEQYLGHFRKSKTPECQDRICIHYMIYSKNFI